MIILILLTVGSMFHRSVFRGSLPVIGAGAIMSGIAGTNRNDSGPPFVGEAPFIWHPFVQH